jgi:hypothetical protein
MRSSRLLDLDIDYTPTYAPAAEPTLSDDLATMDFDLTADLLYAAAMGRRGQNLSPGGPLTNPSEADRRRLLTEILDGTEAQIAEILDLDDDVQEAYREGQWNTLRCLDRGYQLLDLLETRRDLRDRPELITPYDDIDGYAPPTEEDRERQILAGRDDEAFRYSTERDSATEDDYDAWIEQDAFIRREMLTARDELIAELERLGVDPKNPAVAKWVKARYEMKAMRYGARVAGSRSYWNDQIDPRGHDGGHGPQRWMATYRSCLYILKRGYRTPFAYSEPAKAPAPRFTAEEMAALRNR